MMGAIDAVCDVAGRIIGKLTDSAATAGPPMLGAARVSDAKGRAPTPAMKRFAVSIARQKNIKPPPGYTTSIAVCSAFLNEYAPKKMNGEATGKSGAKPATEAQMSFATKIAQEKNIDIPDEAKASVTAMAKWIDANKGTKRGKGEGKTARKKRGSTAPRKNTRKRANNEAAAPSGPAPQSAGRETPLEIPYGNKDTAMKLGARYRSGGWYAPPGADLTAFDERGWL